MASVNANPTNTDNESVSEEAKKDTKKVQVQEVSSQSQDKLESQAVDLETLQRIFKRATMYSIALTLIVAIIGMSSSVAVATAIHLV